MPLNVTVGGFYGDEGKGKIFAYLSIHDDLYAAVTGHGPQAGHSVLYNGNNYVFRQLPNAVFNPNTELLLSAGSVISREVLFDEMNNKFKQFNIDHRLKIDEQAIVILPEHIEREQELVKNIGSVGTGAGIAYSDRALRRTDILAKNFPELKKYTYGIKVSRIVNDYLDEGRNVAIEGAHGTFLSNYHGTYPFVNAYDNTSPAQLSHTGVGKVDHVTLVFKSFVSRVGAGPLNGELSPEEAEKRGWTERGSVSRRLRRAAPFDVELAKESIRLNAPTDIALTKVDVLYPEAYGVTDYNKLSEQCQVYIQKLEKDLGGKVPITLIGTGPGIGQVVDMRKERGTL